MKHIQLFEGLNLYGDALASIKKYYRQLYDEVNELGKFKSSGNQPTGDKWEAIPVGPFITDVFNKYLKGDTFLDVGCGFGNIVRLAEKFKMKSTGLEINKDYKKYHSGISVIYGNAKDFDYSNYDVIFLYRPMPADKDMFEIITKIFETAKPETRVIYVNSYVEDKQYDWRQCFKSLIVPIVISAEGYWNHESSEFDDKYPNMQESYTIFDIGGKSKAFGDLNFNDLVYNNWLDYRQPSSISGEEFSEYKKSLMRSGKPIKDTAPKMSLGEFKKLCVEKLKIKKGFDPRSLPKTVLEDLKKIKFRSESFLSCWFHYHTIGKEPNQYEDFNFPLGYEVLENGLPVYFAIAGSTEFRLPDFPICFCIYWDGREFRGFVPLRGNVFERVGDAMMAYTPRSKEDVESCKRKVNPEEIRKEISEQIKVV